MNVYIEREEAGERPAHREGERACVCALDANEKQMLDRSRSLRLCTCAQVHVRTRLLVWLCVYMFGTLPSPNR